MLTLIIILGRKDKQNAFASWAWTISGILYIGWLMSYYIALRGLESGMGWVFLSVLGTFASDIGAYLSGRFFGKHKMAPYISPQKTWEGAVGGVIGSIIIIW
jgi:phosphatidate cytidylyltransferase